MNNILRSEKIKEVRSFDKSVRLFAKFPKYKYALAFLDFTLLLLLFYASIFFGVYYGNKINFKLLDFVLSSDFLLTNLYLFSLILIFQYNNLYKLNVFLTFFRQFYNVAKSFIYVAMGMFVLSFFIKSSYFGDTNRLVILYFFIFGVFFFPLVRALVVRKAFMFLSKNRFYKRRVAIVGINKSSKLLAFGISSNNYGVEIVGFIDDGIIPRRDISSKRFPVLGNIDDIKSIVEDNKIDEIIVSGDGTSPYELMEILDRCKETKADVKVSSKMYSIISNKLFLENYGNFPVVDIPDASKSIIIRIYKRVFDMIGATVGLILLSPLFVVIAILIKLTSKGPVFFKQTRIGKNGKPFTFYKFRSMYVGDNVTSRKDNIINFIKAGVKKSDKIIDENRITPIGKFIRKTSLDELPQLFNVLKGEMSLVGPRPCVPYEWEVYDEWQRRRLSVTPGCTGLWQVAGRGEVSFNDMVILDLYYIDNMSPWFDMQIILKTIPVMVLGKGGK